MSTRSLLNWLVSGFDSSSWQLNLSPAQNDFSNFRPGWWQFCWITCVEFNSIQSIIVWLLHITQFTVCATKNLMVFVADSPQCLEWSSMAAVSRAPCELSTRRIFFIEIQWQGIILAVLTTKYGFNLRQNSPLNIENHMGYSGWIHVSVAHALIGPQSLKLAHFWSDLRWFPPLLFRYIPLHDLKRAEETVLNATVPTSKPGDHSQVEFPAPRLLR